MNRNTESFNKIKIQRRKALSVFITAGYPDMNTTAELILSLSQWGVDFIELGVPFSDPIADGPVIQYSSHMSLQQGTNLLQVLTLVRRLREQNKVKIPILLMSYYNPIYSWINHHGTVNLGKRLTEFGIDGLIIPDLPVEESTTLKSQLAGLVDLVLLIAPTSSVDRIKNISQSSQGFVYVVSVTGVTGLRQELPPELTDFLTRVRQYTKVPTMLGFGISTPEHITRWKPYVDGFIVGSAVIKIIKKNTDRKIRILKLEKFIRQLRTVL